MHNRHQPKSSFKRSGPNEIKLGKFKKSQLKALLAALDDMDNGESEDESDANASAPTQQAIPPICLKVTPYKFI